jgi:hypothetical protein
LAITQPSNQGTGYLLYPRENPLWFGTLLETSSSKFASYLSQTLTRFSRLLQALPPSPLRYNRDFTALPR